MDLIESFSIDHRKIVPGIFKSRMDNVEGACITTYDIRLKKPNKVPAIDIAAMHSLEHIIATYLRNDPVWKNEIIYFGPMGCLTGFYLILKGNRTPQEIYPLVYNAFNAVESYKSVPGATEKNCGNYKMHNLYLAKWYAADFKSYLKINQKKPKIYEYPKTKRSTTKEGQRFFDS